MGTESQALSLQKSYKPSNKAGTRARIFSPRVGFYSPHAALHPIHAWRGAGGSIAARHRTWLSPTPTASPSLLHPKDAQINTGFPVPAASKVQVGNVRTIPGEHPVHINTAAKTKVADREAHVLENNPRDHQSQKLKCLENMKPQCKEAANQEALGTS